jgi:hypothetical protein
VFPTSPDPTGNSALDLQAFYAGRGVAKSADLGRDSPAQGRPLDVFCGLQHVVGVDSAVKVPTSNPYFTRTPFGTVRSGPEGDRSNCSGR